VRTATRRFEGGTRIQWLRVATVAACAAVSMSALVATSCDGNFEAPCQYPYMTCSNNNGGAGNGGSGGGTNSNNNNSGCETNILTDPSNCGVCGNPCSGTESCLQGKCVSGSGSGSGSCPNGVGCGCSPGFASCKTPSACETSISTDANNCGQCGHVCSSGSCILGSCSGSGSCPPGETPCNTCTNVSSDPSNCGRCGNVCSSTPGSSGVCMNGFCSSVTPPVDAGNECVAMCSELQACDTSNAALTGLCSNLCATNSQTFAACAGVPPSDCNGLAACAWQPFYVLICGGVGGGPTGGGTCNSSITCEATTCAGNQSCVCGCITQAAPSVAFALLDFDVCVQASETGTCAGACSGGIATSACMSCAESACSSELNSCLSK